MKLYALATFLVSLTLASSLPNLGIFGENPIQRFKRGYFSDGENESNGVKCPKQMNECLKCLDEFTDDLKSRICEFDIVAEVILSGPPKCGRITNEKTIKNENAFSNNMKFSMPDNCDKCQNMMDKTVTLLSSRESYDFDNDGFNFGPETYLIAGNSPINDCKSKGLRSLEQLTTAITEVTLITEAPKSEVTVESNRDQSIDRRNIDIISMMGVNEENGGSQHESAPKPMYATYDQSYPQPSYGTQSYTTPAYPAPPAYPKPNPYPAPPTYAKPEPYPSPPAYPKPEPYPAPPKYAQPDPYPAPPKYAQPDPYPAPPAYPKPEPYPAPPTYAKPEPYPAPPAYPKPEPYPEPPTYSQPPSYAPAPTYEQPPTYPQPMTYSEPYPQPPSYGYPQPQAYPPPAYPQPMSYAPVPSYSPAYSPPSYGDYYASSSDILNTTHMCPPIADSCPTCSLTVAVSDVLDSFCDYNIIVEANSTNHSNSSSDSVINESCDQLTAQNIIKSDPTFKSSFFYSMNPKCKCEHILKPSVILLTKTKSWTKSGLSLSESDVILESSPKNLNDIKDISEAKKCNSN